MRISDKKRQKISEHILSVLFDNYPQSLFTSQIAEEIVRDEEFTKSLLQDLKSKELVTPITKNQAGLNYLKRTRWRLSNKAHEVYSKN
ncbi:MAG: hypothetical protein WC781_03205 [Candidatus Pacearchaeota archaeon]|jgi:hypothetical protein